jgi:hypothetical protein
MSLTGIERQHASRALRFNVSAHHWAACPPGAGERPTKVFNSEAIRDRASFEGDIPSLPVSLDLLTTQLDEGGKVVGFSQFGTNSCITVIFDPRHQAVINYRRRASIANQVNDEWWEQESCA